MLVDLTAYLASGKTAQWRSMSTPNAMDDIGHATRVQVVRYRGMRASARAAYFHDTSTLGGVLRVCVTTQ